MHTGVSSLLVMYMGIILAVPSKWCTLELPITASTEWQCRSVNMLYTVAPNTYELTSMACPSSCMANDDIVEFQLYMYG